MPSEAQDGIIAMIAPCFSCTQYLARFVISTRLLARIQAFLAVNSLQTVESASDLSRLRTERSWYRDGSGEPWLPAASADRGLWTASR